MSLSPKEMKALQKLKDKVNTIEKEHSIDELHNQYKSYHSLTRSSLKNDNKDEINKLKPYYNKYNG